MFDKTLIKTKHLKLYLSVYQMGFALTIVPSYKSIYLLLGVFEFKILYWISKD